jgi:hypothetical protein
MFGRRPHAQRRRRWFAATACVLWLLGVEVLPDLHLAFHADDHTHGPDGTIVHVGAHHDHAAAHARHGHGHGREHGHDHGHRHDHGHDHGHGVPEALAALPADAPPADDPLAPFHEDPAHALATGETAPAAPAALVWRDAEAAHDRGAASESHHSHRPHRDRGDRTLDHAPSPHSAAGVAHHAIALHRPPPPLLEPLPVLRAAWRLEHAPDSALHETLRARPNARGPPATA